MFAVVSVLLLISILVAIQVYARKRQRPKPVLPTVSTAEALRKLWRMEK